MNRWGYDEVNGIVIGDVETRKRYRFVSERTGMVQGKDMYFENDKEAVEYARINHPEAFSTGIEIRIFDR